MAGREATMLLHRNYFQFYCSWNIYAVVACAATKCRCGQNTCRKFKTERKREREGGETMQDRRETKMKIFVKKLYLKIDFKAFYSAACVCVHVCACMCMHMHVCMLHGAAGGAWCE